MGRTGEWRRRTTNHMMTARSDLARSGSTRGEAVPVLGNIFFIVC
jgi:hypothetical protein